MLYCVSVQLIKIKSKLKKIVLEQIEKNIKIRNNIFSLQMKIKSAMPKKEVQYYINNCKLQNKIV